MQGELITLNWVALQAVHQEIKNKAYSYTYFCAVIHQVIHRVCTYYHINPPPPHFIAPILAGCAIGEQFAFCCVFYQHTC